MPVYVPLHCATIPTGLAEDAIELIGRPSALERPDKTGHTVIVIECDSDVNQE